MATSYNRSRNHHNNNTTTTNSQVPPLLTGARRFGTLGFWSNPYGPNMSQSLVSLHYPIPFHSPYFPIPNGHSISLLVLNVGNFREWSTITMNNHPIPLFPSIPYQAPVSHEIGKITIATSRDFPLGFHRRCLCPQASPSKWQSACGPTLIPPLPLGIKCLV